MLNYNTTYTNIITLTLSMAITILLLYFISRVMENNKNELVVTIKNFIFYAVVYYAISRLFIAIMEGSPFEIFRPDTDITNFGNLFKTLGAFMIITCYSLIIG